MTSETQSEGMTLRAHHICCLRFWSTSFTDRGQAFSETEGKIKKVLGSGSDVPITVSEGPDMLCKVCPLCEGDRCESPNGNEEQVMKWDSILLSDLNIPFGSTLSAREWQTLVEEKAPFKICQKCKWREVCNPG